MDTTRNANKQAIPGPGSYEETQAINKTGVYHSSQMNNSKAARINTGRRWKEPTERSPGPGYYEDLGGVAKGSQVCSNFHSTIVKNIGTTEKRHQWGGNPRFRTPGPGTYRPPSDFGYLDFKGQFAENRSLAQNTHGTDASMAPTPHELELGKYDSHMVSF
mmetsp:Transcript_306/g.454  ORF Transcript_306/g.454 Transcript_306/m.454 type:complete len:161 (-) Transcript_306:657-1139(-)